MQPVTLLTQQLPPCQLKGLFPVQERDRTFQCTRPPQPSHMFKRKRWIVLPGIVPNIQEVRQHYISWCPANSERVYPWSSPLWGSPCEDRAIVQRYGSRQADGEGAVSQCDSGWRWSLSTARQWADGEEATPQQDSRWRWSHSHGDTAGVQRMAREPCHGKTAGG
jgi:hypothetical protein